MSVKVPAFVLEAIGGSLVEAHRIRERDLEAAIIARGEPLQDVGQTVALVAAQLIQACGVAPTGHKSLVDQAHADAAKAKGVLASFVGTTDYNGVFADPAGFAKKVHLLWLGVGTKEPERMRTGLLRLHTSLQDANIQHVFYESPETDHEWQTWRRDLKDFAPRLFQ